MFIVHQDGDLCVEVNKVSYSLEYSDKVKLALKEIYNRRIEKRYYYGSTENCEYEIEKEQEMYIRNNKIEKEFHIFVNGTRFAIFEDHDTGNKVFRFIIECLGNGTSVVDLSKINLCDFNC